MNPILISRRSMLRQSLLCLAGIQTTTLLAADPGSKPLLRIGLVTDLHYADKPPTKTRFYREALGKLDEAVDHFNKERPAFVVELGDFIDAAPTVELETQWLETMEKRFARLAMPRHYVLGNHCVTTLTKEEFAAHTGASKFPHYAFDEAGIRVLLLELLRRLDLPRVELAQQTGAGLAACFTALEAADRRDLQPLVDICRDRLAHAETPEA